MEFRKIKTVVIVMMENRSFDNLLGHLSLGLNGRKNVDGLGSDSGWDQLVANRFNGHSFPPFQLTDPYHAIDADPPHERANIAEQLGKLAAGKYPMNGFVENYATAKGAGCLTPDRPPPVMGYFTGQEAPVTDFFAKNFLICDHWFSALPAGTQPNRMMAMAGETTIDTNVKILPRQKLVYDWLTEHNVRWRVYHQGAPFFSMMLDWVPAIIGNDRFRPLKELSRDIDSEPPGKFPQVIFIEPTYTDSPHFGGGSDDHAPSAIKGGQQFLLEVYRDLTQDPDLFAGMVAVITYDEHGGFFDHVSPPMIPTLPPQGSNYTAFQSLGVRVPSFIISPFVKPGAVSNEVFDHTSILKMLGKLFNKDGTYSKTVNDRPVGNVLDVLDPSATLEKAPTISSLNAYLAKDVPHAGFVPGTTADTPMKEAFQNALEVIRRHQGDGQGKFADLLSHFPSIEGRQDVK